MHVLLLTSRPRGADSNSSRVANEWIADITGRDPGTVITVRDLAADPLPHIDADFVAATRGPDGPQTDRQRALVARSDKLLAEVQAADTIIIATAMINFTIPSTLKAWFDWIGRPGKAFAYVEGKPKGLLTGKRVIVIGASGGIYAGENPAGDYQRPYLKWMLGFLGLTDVEFIDVEGIGYGVEQAAKSVAAATAKVHANCERAAARAA
jgi:FMN-dependent NADH-azoreductase